MSGLQWRAKALGYCPLTALQLGELLGAGPTPKANVTSCRLRAIYPPRPSPISAISSPSFLQSSDTCEACGDRKTPRWPIDTLSPSLPSPQGKRSSNDDRSQLLIHLTAGSLFRSVPSTQCVTLSDYANNVEYALNAVNQGVTALGIKGRCAEEPRVNITANCTSSHQLRMESFWLPKRNPPLL